MAASWIKMRGNLAKDGRVKMMARHRDVSVREMIGGLYLLWALADEMTVDGKLIGYTTEDIDELCGPEFCAAMLAPGVEWLALGENFVQVVKFTEHNGESAKARSQSARRMAQSRERQRVAPEAQQERNTTATESQQQRNQIREDEIRVDSETSDDVSCSEPGDGHGAAGESVCRVGGTGTTAETSGDRIVRQNRRTPAPDASPVVLEFPTNRTGVVYALREDKLAEYRTTFPAVDVLAELRRARQWLIDTPVKRKTIQGTPRYLSSWLGRCQDRGGSSGFNPGATSPTVPGPFPIRPNRSDLNRGVAERVAARFAGELR